MIYLEKRKQQAKEVASYNEYGQAMIFNELFALKKTPVDFVIRKYTDQLEGEINRMNSSINSLQLMLAAYCMRDTSELGKTSRKHLYDSKAWGGHDGSPFGKMLEAEFGNTKK